MARSIRTSFAWLGLIAAWSVVSVCHGSMAIFKAFDVDFTKAKDAQAKASWSPAEKLSITKEGLGWDGEGASSCDGWIEWSFCSRTVFTAGSVSGLFAPR
jgi:hypothetical protein